MIRNLKFLGLALVAALAMSSVVASLASADTIGTETNPTTLTGAQEATDVFTVHGGEVKCTTVKYTGTLTALSSSSVTVTPTYSGCTFAGLAASVNMNGCSYRVDVNTAAGNTTGTVAVICASGKEITVTAPSVGTPKCIVHVPGSEKGKAGEPNSALGPGSAVNLGSLTTREITLSLKITNIAYSQTAGTAETGNCATADSTTGGTYTGTAKVTGENAAGTVHIGIFLS